MKLNKFISVLLLFYCFSSCINKSDFQLYRDSKLPIEERVENLLSLMTIEEKVRQLDMYSGSQLISNGVLDTVKANKEVGNIGIGSIHDFYPTNTKDANELQRFIIRKSRLGIPAIFIEEGLHGYEGVKATTFPVLIGIGSSWNSDLAYQIGRAIGTEARSKNVHMLLAPTLEIGREPRWGRLEESFSEDVFLVSGMGASMIKGMQGENLSDSNAVVSEPKHFAVHAIPAGGRNTGTVFVGEREARSSFLPAFEAAVKEGNAQGMMAAYHELDGIPCAANKWLLTDVLRKEWGFNGFVLSDLGAIRRLKSTFRLGKDDKTAIIKALEAGLDMQFYDFPNAVFQNCIIDAVKNGEMQMSTLDRAVKNVLRVKFKLGLFDNPYIDEGLSSKVYHCAEHQKIAKQAGLESIILLRNEGDILPLSKNKIKSIAVLGDLANQSLLGGYSPKNVHAVTVLEGIQQKVGEDIQIKYCKGISIPKYETSISGDNVFVEKGKPGIKVEYFNNLELKGTPDLVRIENDFIMDWHNLSPAPGIDDFFSARLTGFVVPEIDGKYKIRINTGNKVRYYFDNKLVFDGWSINSNSNKGITIDLKAGQYYPIKIEFSKTQSFARINIFWSLTEKSPKAKNDIFQKAVNYAKSSDIAIIVIGESSAEVGEGKDKMNLDLEPAEEELLKAVHATGTPVILVLENGRPLTIPWAAGNLPVILESWFPGEFGGEAIADILFGDYNPSGRLPISIPKHVGQVPVFYNHKGSFNHDYVDCDSKPLFPFGHGLSYTSFNYSNLKLSKSKIRVDESVSITVEVTNTGEVEGADVVQLYIKDNVSSVATPEIALKGFKKVHLKPRETKKVEFMIGPNELSLWNIDMKKVVEPGGFTVMIGRSCENIVLKDILEVY